jgi:hypothetical protein
MSDLAAGCLVGEHSVMTIYIINDAEMVIPMFRPSAALKAELESARIQRMKRRPRLRDGRPERHEET